MMTKNYKKLTIILSITTVFFLVATFILAARLGYSQYSCDYALKETQNSCDTFLNKSYEREDGYSNMLADCRNETTYWMNSSYNWMNNTKNWCVLYFQMMDLYNGQIDISNDCAAKLGSTVRFNKMQTNYASCIWWLIYVSPIIEKVFIQK